MYLNPEDKDGIRQSMDHNGVAVVRGLLDTSQVAALRDLFEAHEAAGITRTSEILYTREPPRDAPAGMGRLLDQWLNPHRRPPPLSTLPVAATLRARVEDWLGEPAVLFQDVLINKRAGHAPFPWHQDFPFWPVDRPAGVIVWIPLDPSDARAGGLELAPGTHRQGIGPAIDLHTGAPQPGHDEAPLAPPAVPLRLDLAPGDAVLFHPLLLHSSPENGSGRPRRAWASTWLAGSARWSIARAPRHPLCKLIKDGALVTTGASS